MHTSWKRYLRRVHFKGKQLAIRDAGPRGLLGSVSGMSELLTALIRQNPERQLASLTVPLELPFVDAAVCAGAGQVAGFYSNSHTHTHTALIVTCSLRVFVPFLAWGSSDQHPPPHPPNPTHH